MVKILSNGDIVPDDDPRAQAESRPQSRVQAGSLYQQVY